MSLKIKFSPSSVSGIHRKIAWAFIISLLPAYTTYLETGFIALSLNLFIVMFVSIVSFETTTMRLDMQSKIMNLIDNKVNATHLHTLRISQSLREEDEPS